MVLVVVLWFELAFSSPSLFPRTYLMRLSVSCPRNGRAVVVLHESRFSKQTDQLLGGIQIVLSGCLISAELIRLSQSDVRAMLFNPCGVLVEGCGGKNSSRLEMSDPLRSPRKRLDLNCCFYQQAGCRVSSRLYCCRFLTIFIVQVDFFPQQRESYWKAFKNPTVARISSSRAFLFLSRSLCFFFKRAAG